MANKYDKSFYELKNECFRILHETDILKLEFDELRFMHLCMRKMPFELTKEENEFIRKFVNLFMSDKS